MATQSYESARQMAKALSRDERLRLIEELTARAARIPLPSHSTASWNCAVWVRKSETPRNT